MNIKKIELYYLNLTLNKKFTNSKTTVSKRDLTIIKLTDSNNYVGYGEIVGFSTDWYIKETQKISRKSLIKNIHKLLNNFDDKKWEEFLDYDLAKTPSLVFALDTAYTMIKAQINNKSLKEHLNIKNDYIYAAIVLDLKQENLIKKAEECLNLGYTKIKFKLTDNSSLEEIKEINKKFPNLKLTLDFNKSCLIDSKIFKEINTINISMIEEPLIKFNEKNYKKLKKKIKTKIFIDESYQNINDIKAIIKTNSCDGFVIKACKIGRINNVINIVKGLNKYDYKTVFGSMYETSLGKFIHAYLSTYSSYLAPDLSDYRRYFKEDILKKNLIVNNGKILLPENIEVNEEILNKYSYKYLKYEA